MQENTAFELNEEPLRYEPLPDPAAQRETNTFSSEAGGLREAARELNDGGKWVMY